MSEHYFHVVCVTQEHSLELIFGKIYKAVETEQHHSASSHVFINTLINSQTLRGWKSVTFTKLF
jgi:hypothetical protein